MNMSHFFTSQPSTKEILDRVEGFSSWIEVDLDALSHNLSLIRDTTGAEVVPCIKKDGYGHGIVPITAYLMQEGVHRVLVAKLWEARQIRDAGLTCGVINMDPLFSDAHYEEAVERDITQTIYHRVSAERLSQASAKLGKPAKIWVKVDTGLGRVGVHYSVAVDLIEYISSLPGLVVDGLFSTLLEDHNDSLQIERLKEVKNQLSERGVVVHTLSIASSHGIFFRSDSYLDAVRPGVMLFGFFPVPESKGILPLKQAISLKGRLEHVKWVDPGTPLTYGGAFVAPKRMKVGTMHMGYSDGYLRELTKKGLVKVGGDIRKIIGGVSINHFLIDLEDSDVEVGDEVDAISLIGENDGQNLCDLAGIEPYQMMVWMNPLTPRVYLLDGAPVALSELKLTPRI